jgi:hypothetical protein
MAFRAYTPLPIDATLGFPQAFPVVFNGQTYRFRLYVNVPVAGVVDKTAMLELPTDDAFLVVQVERQLADGTVAPIFQRKVVPALEYVAENIALTFTAQRVAVRNLNSEGNFGSVVSGGIAAR